MSIEFIVMVVLILIFLIMSYILINKEMNIRINENSVEIDRLTKDIVINNDSIEALDSIINEIIDEYVIFVLKPKDIYYINSNMEEQLRSYVTEELSNRISPVLFKKLEYNYNASYLPTIFAKKIYLHVMAFSLEYNMNSDIKEKK